MRKNVRAGREKTRKIGKRACMLIRHLRVHCHILKRAQFKVYGIGHRKNYNKLLQKVINAREKKIV